MVLEVRGIVRSKGVMEGTGVPYDNVVVYGVMVNDTSANLLCGAMMKAAKFKSDVFFASAERNIKALNNPHVKEIKDFENLHLVPVIGEYGLAKGACEDFFLQIPDGLFPADSFPNEVVPEKADKKK